MTDDKDITGPPVPEWMIEEAEKWRRLKEAGVIVPVPMTETEFAEEAADFDL